MSRRTAAGRLAEPFPTPVPAEDPVRADERRRLARELYDILAHHLSNVALRTMGRLDVHDLVGLQSVLADVNRATGSALVELRLLAHVLADDPTTLAGTDGAAELSRRPAPTLAAEQWRRRLSGTGRSASYAVPEAADLLALSLQSTIARTFDATGEAALAHTAVDARCSTTVHVGPAEVFVRSTMSLPAVVTDRAAREDREDQLGERLRGLRERVHLSHGQLAASVHPSEAPHGDWVVTVTLPLS